MDPVTAILGAASLAGGILSHAGGRKAIDPNWLKQHFGAQAVNQEFLDLFNSIINSPQGQQLMANAAEQGQQFARDINTRTAAAGLGPASGAESGSSIFATAAGEGAVNALQRGVKSDISSMALPIAQQIVQDRMSAAVQSKLQEQATPTPFQQIAGTIGEAAGTALNAIQPKADTSAPTSALNAAAQMPTTVQGRGSLAGVSSVIPSVARNRGTFSRLGRGLSRFGARFGNFVMPGNPLGQGAQ